MGVEFGIGFGDRDQGVVICGTVRSLVMMMYDTYAIAVNLECSSCSAGVG